MVKVPLYSGTRTPVIATCCPFVKLCGEFVVIVTVVPDSVAVEIKTTLPKLFSKLGGAITVSVAVLLVPPAPDSVVLTLPVVLSFAPAVVPLTATLIEQEPPDVSEPPAKLMLVFPAAGANTPPQVFVGAGVASTSIPAGKASLIANSFSAKAFGLVKFNVKVDVPLSAMLVGEKLFATVGACATLKVAEAVKPVPP